MDCNSYSYAPTMLDSGENYIAHFSNDDMESSVEKWLDLFNIFAWSYDGAMEVNENFERLETALKLHNFIVENFDNSPPIGNELTDYINKLHESEKPMPKLVEFQIMPYNCKWSKQKAYTADAAYSSICSWYSPKTPVAVMNTKTGETTIFTRRIDESGNLLEVVRE